MIGVADTLRSELDQLVPIPSGGNWAEGLHLAGHTSRPDRRHRSRSAAILVTVVGAAAALAGCLAVAPMRATAATAAPPGCTAKSMRTLVHRFVDDFNTGRLEAIDELWAPTPRFQWFSTGGPGKRLGAAAYDRATLIPYLRSRIREHEKLLIVKLGGSYEPSRHIANFAGKLTRSADDITPRLVPSPNGPRPIHHDFKGAADCVAGHLSLIVWSM